MSTCLLFPGPLGCVGRQLLRRKVVFAASIGGRLNQSSLVPCPADSSVIGLLQLRMYLARQKAMCEGLLWVGSKRYQKKTISGGQMFALTRLVRSTVQMFAAQSCFYESFQLLRGQLGASALATLAAPPLP